MFKTAGARTRKAGYWHRRTKGDIIVDLIIYAVMLIVIFATLFPFLNVIAIAFNDSTDSVKGGIGIFPRIPTLDNFKELGRYPNLLQGGIISLLRTVVGTVCSLLSTCMLAYVLSRKEFMFRRLFMTLFLFTMYVDSGIIPHFMVIRALGLNNSFWVYIIPGLISAYNLILVRSFIEQIPFSLQESAFLDGANDFTIFRKIIMPLCLPVTATVGLFYAVGQWNSWFDTKLYAFSNEKITTLQYELMKILQQSMAQQGNPNLGHAGQIAQSQSVSPLSIRMTVTLVAVVPILLVYPFVQKYFVSGLTLGAVKS
ncbi:MAG: carbohydrate ABC transporter permease [Oscillospiraceae bacterium]|jgi:putative aldouronate transport system permease protein|nr:carbohydrate ABC transporter permease [Oscillospiraceae bacterium]